MKNKNNSGTDLYLNHSIISGRLALLLIGIVLMLLSDMRGSAGVFAWIMTVPFLIYSVLYRGFKNHLWLLLSLLLGSVLTLMKASSDPFFISIGFSIMSGIVIGLRYFLVFLIWGYIRRRAGDLAGMIAFPSVIVCFEYLQAFYLPFGDWGSLANTQLYNLPLLQTASLVGFLGISALIAWAAVLIASIMLAGSLAGRKVQLSAFAVVFIVLLVYGDLRLDRVPEGKHINVAGIMVNNQFSGEFPDPDDPAVLAMNKSLLEKTARVADQGAAVVVWGEGSTMMSEQGEPVFLKKLSALARENNVSIVAAYAVLLKKKEQTPAVHFLNKFTWILNNGEIGETYLKHHPVIGEGSRPGVKPLKLVHTEYGNMAGAICYDYDFPEMALTHSRLGADLVLIPGMDWRGMLKRHTLMARIRAIEGGFSLFRSANGATSMGFDNLGQIRASMSDFGDNDKVLLASLPLKQNPTLYSRTGNVLAYLAIAALLVTVILSVRNHCRRKQELSE